MRNLLLSHIEDTFVVLTDEEDNYEFKLDINELTTIVEELKMQPLELETQEVEGFWT
jgi:hypothetical protein